MKKSKTQPNKTPEQDQAKEQQEQNSQSPKKKGHRKTAVDNDDDAQQNKKGGKAQDDQAFIMKQGDYRIQVTVLQVKDIIPKDTGLLGSNTADPLVQIQVMGQTQSTQHKEDTLHPIYNETLFFHFKDVKVIDLQVAQIDIKLFDYNTFSRNSMLGQFSIDIQFIYKASKYHDIFHKWVAIIDPQDATGAIKAYVKVSISVLGPGDKPHIHSADDIQDGNNLLMPNTAKQEGYLIKAKVYRAEHLAPLDLLTNTTDAYVKITFGASKIKTKVVKKTRNPVFNQQLNIPASIPTMNKKVKLQVFDYDFGSSCDMIGSILLDFSQLKLGAFAQPKWFNLYGPNLTADNEYSQLMLKHSQLGSHYRGRILLSLEGMNQRHPKLHKTQMKFEFPLNPAPSPPQIVYKLSIFVYEGIQLPQSMGDQGCIHIECGPYNAETKIYPLKGGRLSVYQRVQIMVTAPCQPSQIPDIIIFHAFGKQNSDKISFLRFKAADFLLTKEDAQDDKDFLKPVRYRLEDDRSGNSLDQDEFPGFLYL